MRQSSRIVGDAKRRPRNLQNDSTRETSVDVQCHVEQRHSACLQEIHARREERSWRSSTTDALSLFQPMEIYIDNETKLSLDVSVERRIEEGVENVCL